MTTGTETRCDRLSWFREARLGMFVHWGLYAIPAGEWNGRRMTKRNAEQINLSERIPNEEYEKLAESFTARDFDADRWVAIAKEAGARYLVVTAKHQDGFAMFRSRVNGYNVVDATPFARDPIEELAGACARAGLRLGLYYSHARDYHHPGANWNDHGNTWDFPPQTLDDFRRYFAERVIPHVTELLTSYGEICLMWFDVPYRIPRDLSTALRSHVLSLQPGCLVNSRIGNGQGDYLNPGDNELPGTPPDGPWETCMTMNDSWGYSRFDENWKSVDELVRILNRVVAMRGNLLLNVGPDAAGRIPPASVERLRALGLASRADHG